MKHATPLASRVVHGVTGHLSSCIWNLWVFPDDAWGVSAPSCCDFIHRVAFEDVSSHRVLIKSGLGNRGLSECGSPHEATSQIFLETGLILRWDGNVGNPFQTKQGNRLSCRDQEGRRGSGEVVPGTSVFLSSETGMLGNFLGCIKRAKYHFDLQFLTWEFS